MLMPQTVPSSRVLLVSLVVLLLIVASLFPDWNSFILPVVIAVWVVVSAVIPSFVLDGGVHERGGRGSRGSTANPTHTDEEGSDVDGSQDAPLLPVTARSAFHSALNVEDKPSMAYARARDYVDALLERARVLSHDDVSSNAWEHKPYVSKHSFEERMYAEYHNLAREMEDVEDDDEDDVDSSDPLSIYRSFLGWHHFIVQSSPFNLVDGAWLSGSFSPGPFTAHQ
eukprot:TRINITY_DN3153_c0_g1_i2.p1 TRINITY_DN3153_c0_g1~~TRINITY_DN3153_c0_g1_i2.p1  ORF type:complete len:226 (+),score=41.44 TRINITY_DN3153_c0_g1_i2:494-1171(+)